jgi:hypothetical protein
VVASGYILPARLDPVGQRYQGDIVAAAPILCPLPTGATGVETHPAISLSPTCDFALKASGDIRYVCAIEVLTLESPLRQQFAQNTVPQHVVPLPPLDPLLPYGGAVLLRRTSPIHVQQLETLTRVATVDAAGLQSLLVGHTRYYVRIVIDGTHIAIPPDDPRLLWSAVDAALVERRVIAKRDAVARAEEIAIAALAQHHGVKAPNTAISLYRLSAIAAREAASPSVCAAIRMLLATMKRLEEIYLVPPHDPTSSIPELNRLASDLEIVGRVLQERNPVQFNEQQYRALIQGQSPRSADAFP